MSSDGGGTHDIRNQVLEHFARLFERQVRMHQFADSINALVESVHGEIIDGVEQSMQHVDELPLPAEARGDIDRLLGDMRRRCDQLERTLNLLLGERARVWAANGKELREAMLNTNRMVKTLDQTLHELEYYSSHDPLTGLHNRRYFNDILTYEIDRSARHQHEFALVMLDLDDFKEINDTYGHPCGDNVLCAVADIMRSAVRRGDIVTRIGGDEFAIVLTETTTAGAQRVAEQIRRRVREKRFHTATDDEGFHITVSIGLVSYPHDASSLADLLAGVDAGLYQAKARGKDGVMALHAVRDVLEANRSSRAYVERLRASLKNGEVMPYFQPIVDCRNGRAIGFECLARMREPDGAVTSANRFVTAMEKYGLGRELDQLMIRQSMAALRQQTLLGGQPLKLFINLSAQEIQGRGVLGYAERVCREFGISSQQIVFEIMERDTIADMAHMRSFISELRDKGFQFALDDFGSGYNSFHYLRELQFDYLKIDGAFVRNILTSRVDYALVRNLSRLCQEIGTLTIAEFVESDALMRSICEIGIDYAQGFHLGHPAEQMVANG